MLRMRVESMLSGYPIVIKIKEKQPVYPGILIYELDSY